MQQQTSGVAEGGVVKRSQFIATLAALWLPISSKAKAKPDVTKIFGKIQFVDSFPDFKVQVVSSFPDLKVQRVSSFADKVGLWQTVTSFPDYKIQLVNSCPDFTIQYVNSFPGPG
jgi:hypothetical protein